MELAKRISLAIPAPFIRIDFLKSFDGLVFGEFTGHPGSYEQFNRKTDRLLGEFFVSAEARIVNDLLNGKTFDAFQALKK